MAITPVPTRSLPKRKRAVVNYHESCSEESEHDDECSTSDDEFSVRAKKKLKRNPAKVQAKIPAKVKPFSKRNIFPFTSLPAELRNQIYDLALSDCNMIYLSPKTKHGRYTAQRLRGKGRSAATALVPNLALLNKTIHAEAQPILYGSNFFCAQDIKAMYTFLANIGPKNRALITEFRISDWRSARLAKTLIHPAFTLLAEAVNLEHLQFSCRVGSDYHKRTTARQLFHYGFLWLRAVGVAKGKFDAALDMIDIDKRYVNIVSSSQELDGSPEKKVDAFKAELRKLLSSKNGRV